LQQLKVSDERVVVDLMHKLFGWIGALQPREGKEHKLIALWVLITHLAANYLAAIGRDHAIVRYYPSFPLPSPLFSLLPPLPVAIGNPSLLLPSFCRKISCCG